MCVLLVSIFTVVSAESVSTVCNTSTLTQRAEIHFLRHLFHIYYKKIGFCTDYAVFPRLISSSQGSSQHFSCVEFLQVRAHS